ncbi:MAG: Gfo/Idh/MocA family oxidoreductase [Clostridia bacterium]|nr:Gfo/Idh/MocA family oxidoreductase [Oscillospiraceae bacterium]MBR6762956.1 Gfo/Idh/MocA family oxidoreductase [Clostridia bacterium]
MAVGDAVLNQFEQTKKEEVVADGKKLKVGIIGTGWIAESHIQSYKRMPDVEIVAGADLIPGKAEAFFKEWGVEGVRCYPDHLSMLENEELDAVSVCTYNMTHAVCTIDALERGVNVLLEKPMCVTTEEAVEIIRAEKKSGKVLSIGFQPRFDPNMQQIKKIVEAGVLGEVYYIQTGGGRRRGIPNSTFIEKKTAGIGALGDIGCYSLDMVLNAIGYPKPLTVTGYTSDFFGKSLEYSLPENANRFDVDDFAAAFVRLEGDIILDFRVAWAMHVDTPGDTIIFGKKAALRIPSTDCWNGTVGGPMTIYHDVAGQRVETVLPIIENKGMGLFDRKIRSFLDAIKNGTGAPVPSSQILYNQAIIDHIVKSAAIKKEVEVEIPEI